MYIYDNISLKSSENEKYFRKKLCRENQNTFYVQYLFSFENHAVYDNNLGKYGTASQATDNSIWRIHIEYWIISVSDIC
jgi:hypothetical protein